MQIESPSRLRQLAWLPVPLLALTIAGLWIADLRTVYESRVVMVLLNLVFTWLASLWICVLTARGFLGSGQPGLLMFGCGSLLWGATSLAAAVVVDLVNPTITVHNLGVFGAALCHLVGLLWRGRLQRPGRWLVVGYAGALVTAAVIFCAALAGSFPVFFVQGQGGTPVREVVLFLAAAMFAWVAWHLIDKFRRQAGAFYYWYGLGLALVATGLTGVLLLSVQGGILGWTNRLTQYLGSAYLFVAAFMAARETGKWTFSLAPAEEMARERTLVAGFRQQTPLRWVLRYGMAVGAVVAAIGLRQALTVWGGPGLPPYITLYPVVMAIALLGGFWPGLLATVLGGLLVAYWILPPAASAVESPGDRIGLVICIGTGLFMSLVAEFYQRYRHKSAAFDREAALRESQARVAMFAAATFEGIIESEAGRIVDCNAQTERMLGYTLAELRGMEIVNLVAPEDRDRVVENVRQGQEPMIEHAMLRKDGTRIVVEAHGRPLFPDSATRLTAIRDITERKRAEEALRESRERLDLALVSSRMATFDWDIVTNRRTWSAGVHALLGTKPETFTGTAEEFFKALHPEDQGTVQAALERAVEGTGEYETEYRAVWPDGSIHHISARGKIHHDQAGRAVLMTGVCWDITARKRAEEALRESEVRYRSLFNTIDAGFCVIEMLFDGQGKPVDYRFLEVNAAFEKQTGLHDAQGRLMRELAPTHEAHWFELYGKIALTGEPLHSVNEARALNRWYDVYAYRVGAPESRQVAILFNDISEHKRAEDELRRRAEELRAANEELTRFNRVTVGRELRIIELKKQVNDLCVRLHQPPRYATEPDETAQPTP
jgi:PAS domain S-box-containing protein